MPLAFESNNALQATERYAITPQMLQCRRGRNPLELFFAESPVDLILERPDEIGNDRADRGLDENLDRHAGNELERVEPRKLIRRDRYPHRVKAEPGALIQ